MFPVYEVLDEWSLVLRIPAARLDPVPMTTTVMVRSEGQPLSGIEVLAFYPDRTWVRATTDDAGEAALDLYATHLPMTVYAAGPDHAAGIKREWKPGRDGLALELELLESGGAIIYPEGVGHLPGLRGQLNPVRDATDRISLYADHMMIDEGRRQPVPFRLGQPMRLTDSHGAELSVTIVELIGKAALVEYRPFRP